MLQRSLTAITFYIFASIGLTVPVAPAVADTPPDLAAIPRVVFPHPDTAGGATTYSYGFTVRGAAFADSEQYWLQFKNQPIYKACKTSSADCPARVTRKSSDEIEITLLPMSLSGPQQLVMIQLGNGDGTITSIKPASPLEITFSLVSSWTPLMLTVAVVLALIGLTAAIMHRAPSMTMGNGRPVALGWALLMDMETSTYSLSKFQFYVWTFAGITGYLYLSIAKSLVQGQFQLADVPGNLPGVIMISVGTGIAATAVSNLAGQKGSGDFHPSAADLISSGGVVAPERLQHFLWTILGGLGFLFYTLMISPARIESLPTIPDGFLQMMGISAAGYVGGKIARGPGPNIRSIVARKVANLNQIMMVVDGSNLATKGAGLFLATMPGGTDVAATIAWSPTQSVIAADGTATHLVATVDAPAGMTFVAGNGYRLTIVNQDGEKSAWEFQVTA